MSFASINPYSGEVVEQIPDWDEGRIEAALAQAASVAQKT